MKDNNTHSTSKENSRLNESAYCVFYGQSTGNATDFWKEQGQCLEWVTPYTKVMDYSFDLPNVYIKWFEDGTLNVG